MSRFQFSDKIPGFLETMELLLNFLWDFELLNYYYQIIQISVLKNHADFFIILDLFRLSLLLNVQTMKQLWRIKERRRKEKQKESYSIAKNDLVRCYSFMTSAEKSKTRTPLSSYPQPFNFGLSSLHSCRSLISIRHVPGKFGVLLEDFNNEINILTYSFFLC